MPRTIRPFTVLPSLPERLVPLQKLAYNLWWCWHAEALALFRRIDPELFENLDHSPIRLLTGVAQERLNELAEDEGGEVALSVERYAEMDANQQFVLTLTELGFGKISSSYDFRISNRGGKGIQATDLDKIKETGVLVAGFPVEESDQLMLVSDGGQLIRVPVEGIRFTKRASKGVRVFRTADGEKVVSVERISEPDGEAPGDAEPEDSAED